jgi:hypothetical protein
MQNAMTINDTLHTPLLLGRAAGEEIRSRYATSETLCQVFGRMADGRAYDALVRSAGKGFVVRISMQIRVQQPTRTSEDYYWNKPVVSRHASKAAAVAKAIELLSVVRARA